MRCFLYSFLPLCVFWLNGCNSQDHLGKNQTIDVSNNDITWDGNFAGLCPILHGKTQKILERTQMSNVQSELVAALNDDDKWIAAHVLLTKFVRGQYKVSASEWNGLHVKLLNSGEFKYSESDKAVLKNKWMKLLQIR